MSTSTAIQWTDVTDNIIVVEGGGWWCRMISPGCANCYAAKLNQSEFFGGNKLPYSGEAPKLKLREDIIDGWKRQTKPKRHFVASMTDVFGEWLPIEWAIRFLDAMAEAPKQTFQLLTKRPGYALACVQAWTTHRGVTRLPSNIWLGVSVEDQKRADERIPILLSIPAKVRFLSVEPMLEPIDLTLALPWIPVFEARKVSSPILKSQIMRKTEIPGVDWVIFGGESGPKARPCHFDWIRRGVKQCKEAGVAAFVKQAGSCVHEFAEYAHCHLPDAWPRRKTVSAPGDCMVRILLEHSKGGDPSEWPMEQRVREFPNV